MTLNQRRPLSQTPRIEPTQTHSPNLSCDPESLTSKADPTQTRSMKSSCEPEFQTITLSLIEESDRFRLRYPPYPGVDELAAQIKRDGQHTPLFVRPQGDHYELISGYCRRAALAQLGRPTALCRIYHDISDEAAYALAVSENQGRNNLSALEQADICAKFIREGKTAQQIAIHMGWSDDRTVRSYARFSREAPQRLREALQRRELSFTMAEAILEARLGQLDEALQADLLRRIVDNGMSTKEAKSYIARALGRPLVGSAPVDEARPRRPFLRDFKKGAFEIAVRIDPDNASDLDARIAAQEEALRRSKKLRRELARAACAAPSAEPPPEAPLSNVEMTPPTSRTPTSEA
jgi:ParB/RepB/Spo0J family partition protein